MVLYAKDIVDKDFITLGKEVTALQAAKVMKEKRHGFVVVASNDQKPLGIVTEWDYIEKIVADERDPSKTTLGEIMTYDIITVNANDGIDKVAEIMTQKRIRRVLVLDDGKVIGVITSRTIIGSIKEYVDRVSAQIARLQAPPF
jgi:CBS domain-containing protein